MAKYYATMIKNKKYDWDVIWLDDKIYQYVAEELDDPEWGKKYLVDLETIPGFPKTQKNFIIVDPVYRNQTGGIIVGPYIEGYYYTLWYNKEVADQLGITIKERNMNFDDLLTYVKQVWEYNQSHNTDIAPFFAAKDWSMMEIIFQQLVKSEIPDFTSTKEEIVTEQKIFALKKTLKAFEILGKYKPLVKNYMDNIWFLTRNQILDNKALFYCNGTWMYSHWQGIDKEKTHKMVPVELPVFQPVTHYLGGFIPTWAVFKDSPNYNNAIKLVMFWSRPEVAEKWVRYTKNPTGLRGHVAKSGIGTDKYEQFHNYITNKYGANIEYSANTGYLLGNKTLGNQLIELLREILTQQTTAEQAYTELMSHLKE